MIVGDFSVSRPSAPLAAADSSIIQPEFWAIPRTGSPFVMAEVGDFSIAGIAGSRGALSLDVPTNTVLHSLLCSYTVDADADLEVEVRLFGGQARSLRGFLNTSEADEVTESGTRRFSGSLMAQRMYEVRLDPLASDPKGETHFAAKNAGQIVLTLMAIAKARGAGIDIDTSTFNTATDSNGVAWAANTTITLSPGALMGELLEEFEEIGLCEWEVTGFRELKLFVPGTRGVDHTTGPTPTVLHRGRDLIDAPRKHNVRDSITNLLTSGKEGLYATANDASAQARRGRRIEGYATAGQIDNASALTGFTQNKLATLSPGAMELTHGLVVNGVGPAPFLDVNIGDWVYSSTGRAATGERLRVQQVSISRSGDVLSASAVVGTLSMSAVVALNRRLARLERGTTVVGTTEADPAAGGADTTPPAAPTGLVASSQAYQDTPTGETLARVDLGWAAVTTDARDAVSLPAQAAQLILDRIQSGASFTSSWLWTGAPPLVDAQNDVLLARYAADGNTGTGVTTDRTRVARWLQSYIADAETAVSDPVVTDDVAGYRVRYAYVGLNQIGGLPSSDPFNDDSVLAYYEPQGSPTGNTSLSFGGVGAGRDVRCQVAAFDRSGNQSVWSNPLTFTTEVDNAPPPPTSPPVISTWFRTLDVYWDGKSADGIDMLLAAPDFDHVAVVVSQQASFTAPTVTGDPGDFDPTVVGAQWVHNMYGAGTYNIANLPVGVGWYAMLVALDRAGNVSGSSAITGPVTAQRLVTIDIGPNAISREQIIDAEIVRAKIADLAVNSAKIEELDVGLIRTGTMTATVTNSGLFRTASTGNRIEFDSAGMRLFQGSTVVGNWKTTDASMLMTGVFQTGLTGERLMMFTDGTLRFYPVAGQNYSQISNFGNDVVWRGPLDGAGRSGRFNVNVLGCGMNFSAESEIPNNLRAEVAVFDRYARITSPKIQFQVNGKLSPTNSAERRMVLFSQTNSSGAEITSSFVYYRMSNTNTGGWFGNGSGIKFEGNVVVTKGEDMGSFGVIQAADFITPSSLSIKTDVVPLREATGRRSVELAQAIRAISYRYRDGIATDGVRHIGLAVEHVAPHAPELVTGADRPATEQGLNAMGVAALALDGVADVADDLAVLRARLDALESAA